MNSEEQGTLSLERTALISFLLNGRERRQERPWNVSSRPRLLLPNQSTWLGLASVLSSQRALLDRSSEMAVTWAPILVYNAAARKG